MMARFLEVPASRPMASARAMCIRRMKKGIEDCEAGNVEEEVDECDGEAGDVSGHGGDEGGDVDEFRFCGCANAEIVHRSVPCM